MILAKARIEDYERFKSVFTTEGAELRRKHGSQGARVFLNADDAHEVWVLFDWSKEEWEGFLADPASREVMGRAGLQGPPESTVVEVGPTTDT